MYVGDIVIHVVKMPRSFKGVSWSYDIELREVKLLAIAEGYAMVRRADTKGAMPYVAPIKELKEKE